MQQPNDNIPIVQTPTTPVVISEDIPGLSQQVTGTQVQGVPIQSAQNQVQGVQVQGVQVQGLQVQGVQVQRVSDKNIKIILTPVPRVPDKIINNVPSPSTHIPDKINQNIPTPMNIDKQPKMDLSNIFGGPSTSNSTTIYTVPVENRFIPLQPPHPEISDDESEDDDDTEQQKPKKPPPIIIHKKAKDHKKYVESIEKYVKKGFHIKYTNNNTNLYIYDNEEYKNYLQLLEENEEIEYHTYTPKEERHHAFILRGMDGNTDINDIKEDIEKKYKIQVHKVFKLKGTQRGLFLTIMDNSITLKYLNKNIHYVFHTKVTWERRRNVPLIIQCRRCQQWGHATANYHLAPVCLKCTEKHWTGDCPNVHKNDPTTSSKIKCAICNGKLLAFSKEWPAYIRKIQQKEKNQ